MNNVASEYAEREEILRAADALCRRVELISEQVASILVDSGRCSDNRTEAASSVGESSLQPTVIDIGDSSLAGVFDLVTSHDDAQGLLGRIQDESSWNALFVCEHVIRTLDTHHTIALRTNRSLLNSLIQFVILRVRRQLRTGSWVDAFESVDIGTRVSGSHRWTGANAWLVQRVHPPKAKPTTSQSSLLRVMLISNHPPWLSQWEAPLYDFPHSHPLRDSVNNVRRSIWQSYVEWTIRIVHEFLTSKGKKQALRTEERLGEMLLNVLTSNAFRSAFKEDNVSHDVLHQMFIPYSIVGEDGFAATIDWSILVDTTNQGHLRIVNDDVLRDAVRCANQSRTSTPVPDLNRSRLSSPEQSDQSRQQHDQPQQRRDQSRQHQHQSQQHHDQSRQQDDDQSQHVAPSTTAEVSSFSNHDRSPQHFLGGTLSTQLATFSNHDRSHHYMTGPLTATELTTTFCNHDRSHPPFIAPPLDDSFDPLYLSDLFFSSSNTCSPLHHPSTPLYFEDLPFSPLYSPPSSTIPPTPSSCSTCSSSNNTLNPVSPSLPNTPTCPTMSPPTSPQVPNTATPLSAPQIVPKRKRGRKPGFKPSHPPRARASARPLKVPSPPPPPVHLLPYAVPIPRHPSSANSRTTPPSHGAYSFPLGFSSTMTLSSLREPLSRLDSPVSASSPLSAQSEPSPGLLRTMSAASVLDQPVLDSQVVSVLRRANAIRYAPHFAEQHLDSMDVIQDLTEDDLISLGVNEMGIRKRLLRGIAEAKSSSSS